MEKRRKTLIGLKFSSNMYPKLFIENFLRGEEREEIFVCMPIDNNRKPKFKTKFEYIIKPAIENLKLKVERSDTEHDKEITQKIIDGILHAKILIFDLSDDPDINGINGNVLYELGLATIIRDSNDIVLIREGKPLEVEKIPFDIRNLTIHTYPVDDLNALQELLWERLNKALEGKNWQKHKLLSTGHRSLDVPGFSILLDRFSDKKNQVYERELGHDEKLSMLRLIDLGIAYSWSNKWRKTEYGSCFEFSYCLTKFGEELKKYIQELSKKSLKEE